MLALAGKLAGRLKATPFVQNRLAGGGKELLKQSMYGAGISGLLSGIATGNPLVGMAVGTADLLASAGAAKQVGKLGPKFAGRYAQVSPVGGVPYTEYRPSLAQTTTMLGTSFAAPALVEPLFASRQLAGLSEEELQQLMAEPVSMDQTATAEQQLLQRQLLSRGATQALSPGTMFQLQGVESSLLR